MLIALKCQNANLTDLTGRTIPNVMTDFWMKKKKKFFYQFLYQRGKETLIDNGLYKKDRSLHLNEVR